MGILKGLFGRKEPPPPPRDVLALAAPLKRPAVHLRKSAADAPSHLGGTPPLPVGTLSVAHEVPEVPGVVAVVTAVAEPSLLVELSPQAREAQQREARVAETNVRIDSRYHPGDAGGTT